MNRYNAQTKWRWGVAIYLFLAGLGAGAYLIGVLMDVFASGWGLLPKVGVALGFPCVALAGLVKLNNLGNPKAAWHAWKKPNCSWIARGTLLLGSFLLVSFLHLLLWVWPVDGVLAEAASARHVLGLIGAFVGLCMILYSGILLTAARPIAFWSTAILPVLFLVSAMLAGAMGIVLVGLIAGEPFEGRLAQVEHWVLGLLVAKAVAVAIYLQSTHRTAEARASVGRVLKGELAALFWLGVAVLGIALPLILGVVALEAGGVFAAVGAACGLLGSLFLRQVVLAGGIHAPLRAGPFEVPLPIV